MDDRYRDLLAECFGRHYEEALRRVTRCARGNVHAAEETIQTVLRRLWEHGDRVRNDKQGQRIPPYSERIFRGNDGDIYIRHANGQGAIPLTAYIVKGACNQLRRPEPQPIPLPPNLAAPSASPDEQDPEDEQCAEDAASWRFDQLRPCLHRLDKENQLIAMADYYVSKYPKLQPFFADFVLTRTGGTFDAIREQWQTRSAVARRTDRYRGRRQLAPCLLKKGLTDFL